MIKTYVSKPIEIQAIQWTGGNLDEIREYVAYPCDIYTPKDCMHYLHIQKIDRSIFVPIGDYVVCPNKYDVYEWDRIDFERKWEEVWDTWEACHKSVGDV